ncbi:hypothetical protein GDO78_000595 [Eleutherodactylus coqui]|uniref:Uncharacterized protein n=1 Tax=Eleutherodactylus coqui TaxID=57060 RepID=A0A8J6FST4_ELECQ|nr:hypothetical protein GDO78_000595 [Eleutherodactylus coqui]
MNHFTVSRQPQTTISQRERMAPFKNKWLCFLITKVFLNKVRSHLEGCGVLAIKDMRYLHILQLHCKSVHVYVIPRPIHVRLPFL